MAGIGFELKKTLKTDRLSSYMKMYGYAGALSAGPWITSIIAILLVGFVGTVLHETSSIDNTQNTLNALVIYAFILALSLIATAPILLPFTRYIADLIFSENSDEVLPVFLGVSLVFFTIAFAFSTPFFTFIFADQSADFISIIIGLFVVLCVIWLANILAMSLKYFRSVIVAYILAYGYIVAASYFLYPNLIGLLLIFLSGNIFLLVILLVLIVKSYISLKLLSFSFFTSGKVYWVLGFSGLFYTLGTWIDKIIFWYHPYTGEPVIGHVNFSVLYDIPIFLAYLSIIPGMSVFFYRLESDFADANDLYFDSIRNGASLSTIERFRFKILRVTKDALREVFVIQAIVSIVLYLNAPFIFDFLNISSLYLGLFNVLLVGVFLQLGFMSVLALLYYMDRRWQAMWLTLGFFILNGLLTLLSIYIGPAFFGFGFAVSLLIMLTASLLVLLNVTERLSYETFMLQ